MKIYESESQIVIRGIDHEFLQSHIRSNSQKVLCVYDTMVNLHRYLKEFRFGMVNKVEFFQLPFVIDEDQINEYILKRHRDLVGRSSESPGIYLHPEDRKSGEDYPIF
jgi:hypothetical protein